MRNPLTLNRYSVLLGLASALSVSLAPLPALAQAVEDNVALFGTNNPNAPATAGGLNQPNFLNDPVDDQPFAIEPVAQPKIVPVPVLNKPVVVSSSAAGCDRSILLENESCAEDPNDVAPQLASPIKAPGQIAVSRVAVVPVSRSGVISSPITTPSAMVVGDSNGEVLEEYLPAQPVGLLAGDDVPYFLPPNVAETASLGEGVEFRPYASLRGGVRFGNGGSRNFIYETEVGAEVDFYSASGQATLNSALVLGKEPKDKFSFISATNAVSGQYDISELTRLDVSAQFDIERESVGDANLPTNTKAAPVFGTGSITAGLSHQFGQFTLTPNVTVERVGFGKTELTNGTELTNESRQYWRGEIGLRARFDITPRVAAIGGVFVDGTWFDANDPVTGLTKDRSSVGLQAGLESNWTDHVKVGVSTTVSVESYQDGAPDSDPNWLFSGFLTYQPNQDLTFSATLGAQVMPSEVAGAKSQVVRTLELASSYLATQDITMRTYLNGEHTSFAGPDTSTANVKIGAGLDYVISDHVTGTLDVSADWKRGTNNLVTNEQEIMVGVTIRP